MNFNPYLKSICETYAQWWDCYTITDVVGEKRGENRKLPPLLHNLMVEKVKQQKEEETERLTVLAGLLKYANDHVLLIGRPGSGKSTALLRLLLESAEETQSVIARGVERNDAISSTIGTNSKIPILVELRFYKTSIIELIRDFLKRHQLWLEIAEIEKLLFERRFLLLFDGVNELPSEAARQDLRKFRQDYQQTTPMIFTTRDLGVGGDLGIEKKLQMQPLIETQMREFVCGYLREQGEELLKQLSGRLRELGETPLLLMMLCSVFVANQNKVPSNLGSVFRRFTEIYDNKLKQDIPVTDESRLWWKRLLQHLAWVMTHGESKTEISVTIPIQEARDILTKFLKEQDYHQPRDAEKWLDDLLKHHLIQLSTDNQIEFRHQLLQEYYAAERLLEELPKLSDDELQWEYLNYLKWTESVALMMQLVDKQSQAVGLVKLALGIDWQLGARLAGEAKEEWQGETVVLIDALEIPLLLKIWLLGEAKSNAAIPSLIKFIEYSNIRICNNAVDALSKINSKQAESVLIKAIKHPNSKVRSHLVLVFGQIATDAIISQLIKVLNDEDDIVRYCVILMLERIASDIAINELAKLLKHPDDYISINAVEALYKIGSPSSLSLLENYLGKGNRIVRFHIARVLSKVGNKKAINDLTRILSSHLKYGGKNIRQDAAFDLGQMGNEVAISELTIALEDEDNDIRWKAVLALTKIKSENSINLLMTALKDKDYEIRCHAAKALEKVTLNVTNIELKKLLSNQNWQVRWKAVNSFNINSNNVIFNRLIPLLKDEDFTVRWKAAEALGNSGNKTFIPQLTKLLTDEEVDVRLKAVESFGKIGDETYLVHLIKALKDRESIVRQKTVQVLVKIADKKAAYQLIKALKDEDSSVRFDAVYALELIGCYAATYELIEILKDEEVDVRFKAAVALGKLATEKAIPQLIKYLEDKTLIDVTDTFGNRDILFDVIFALELIQQRLKYYQPIPKAIISKSTSQEYDLATVIEILQKIYQGVEKMSEQSQISKYSFGNSESIQIIEQNHGQVIGKNIEANKQSLVEAEKEIRELLNQLSQNYPITTESKKKTFVNQFNQEIKTNSRIRNIILAGGIELIKIICPPLGIPIEMGKKWLETAEKNK